MTKEFMIDGELESRWPETLCPVGDGTFEKEAFPIWWERNEVRLSHLPRDLCEQWIYRHWKWSPFKFLPLESLSWRREKWDGNLLLGAIYRAWGGPLSPQFDYDTFHRKGGDDRHPTALALDEGTWDFPMVLLSTPNGVIDGGLVRPQVRLVIVEGHQRHRYLNALHALGRPPEGPHEVLIVSSPMVD